MGRCDGRCRRGSHDVGLDLDFSRATLTGKGQVVGIDIERKVLERVRVHGALLGLCCGQGQDTSIVLGKVLNDALGKGRHVPETMQEIRGKVKVALGAGDGVAKGAHLGQRLASLIGEGADDGLASGIGATPVTSPA